MPKNGGRHNSKGATTARSKLSAAKVPTDPRSKPIHSAIDRIFKNTDDIREALAAQLRDRSKLSHEIAKRAKKAFARFSLQKRTGAHFLLPGNDLPEALQAVIKEGIETRRASNFPATITLRLTDKLNSLVKKTEDPNSGIYGTINLDDLVNVVSLARRDNAARSDDIVLNSCKAELAAEKMLREIQEFSLSKKLTETIADSAEATPTSDLVTHNVNVQMQKVVAPESSLRYDYTSKRSDQTTLQKDIASFELRQGPSDVTSYHDFHSLQIAFKHVWAEVFDGQLKALGQELYQEYVKLKDFTASSDPDFSIGTVDDLNRLMAEIRRLSTIAQEEIPSDLKGTTGTKPTSQGEHIDLGKAAFYPGSVLTDIIGNETLAGIVDPLGWLIGAIGDVIAGKQQLTWESFPGPLPDKDKIAVTFEHDLAPEGTVEIVLKTSANVRDWKGITFWEYDSGGKVVTRFNISTNPSDSDVWEPASYNRLPLYTPQIKSGLLEFRKAKMVGFPTGIYLLGSLNDKINDRTRVTFTWEEE